MDMDIAYYSDIGGRKKNEDAVELIKVENGIVAVLCDGLGGHLDGEIASSYIVESLRERLTKKNVEVDGLCEAIEEVNMQLYHKSRSNGMSSTIAAVLIKENSIMAANVGDTRIYLFRDGMVLFQSKDHSVAYVSVMTGDLSIEKLRSDSSRNILTRSIGVDDEVKIDFTQLCIKTGDAVLICSDGFWEYVWEKEMIDLLSKADSADSWLSMMRSMHDMRISDGGDNNSAISLIFD